MVSFKGLVLLSLGVEAITAAQTPGATPGAQTPGAQQDEVTCSTKLGTASVSPVPSQTSTKTETVTETEKVFNTINETVTPTPETSTITDYDTITVTETAGTETETGTETSTNTIFTTTTNMVSEYQTETSTVTTTSMTTTSTIAAPAGFTGILGNSDYVAKRDIGFRRRSSNDELTISGPSAGKCKASGGFSSEQYPQAVDCFRKVVNTVSETVTIPVQGSTTTLPAVTESVTTTETVTETSTEYPHVTETVTTSIDEIITVTEEATTTSTTTVTATVQVVQPTNFYAACGSNNMLVSANSGKYITSLSSTGLGITTFSATSAYDCCVGCFTTNSSKCKSWFIFGSTSRCYHYTSSTCSINQASGGKYITGSSTFTNAYAGNGPCGTLANGGS